MKQDEIITQLIQASYNLHKKLGILLNSEEYQDRMSDLYSIETEYKNLGIMLRKELLEKYDT